MRDARDGARFALPLRRRARGPPSACMGTRLMHAKMLVFLLHCSNANAVFAIPAGTGRQSPLTQARRAAWRRSERRRRSQRRKKARARQSAGRRSRRAASQSSTSNDVDDCVKRAGASRRAVSASRSCFGTAGSGGRQRASARQGSSAVLAKPRPEDLGVRS